MQDELFGTILNNFATSAKYVMSCPCMFIGWSVSLSAVSHKNYSTDFQETWLEDGTHHLTIGRFSTFSLIFQQLFTQ